MTASLDPAHAGAWIERWDTQQERYVADREERFSVIGDVLAGALAGVDEPVVLDLGCGPGSLSARLTERLPGARIIGVDSDPLLLGLGAAHYRGIEFVDADLGGPGWTGQVPAVIDAAVSTTALHWLPRTRLASVYSELARLMREGGVFANGDHLGLASTTLDELAVAVREGRAERAGVTGNEEWRAWWDAVIADEPVAGLVAERERRFRDAPRVAEDDEHRVHHHGNGLSVAEHAELLRAAGFREVGTVWQSGDDHVLVAIR